MRQDMKDGLFFGVYLNVSHGEAHYNYGIFLLLFTVMGVLVKISSKYGRYCIFAD